MRRTTRDGRTVRSSGRSSDAAKRNGVMAPPRPVAVGLDLAGVPHRRTGFCRIDSLGRLTTQVLHSDSEIVRKVARAGAAIVVVDAPLSLPRGRRSIHERHAPHLRACDRELAARRIPFFPVTLGPMRTLTQRGLRLAGRLRRQGLAVVEGYPGGAQDIWGLPRKGAGVERLRRGLRALGLGGPLRRRSITHDELDAVTLGLVGLAHLMGGAEPLGDPEEGILVVPRADLPPPRLGRTEGAGRARSAGRKVTARLALKGGRPRANPTRGALTRPRTIGTTSDGAKTRTTDRSDWSVSARVEATLIKGGH